MRWISSAALIFAWGLPVVRAQDSTLEEIKYKEDYDRIESIKRVTDIVKRDDRMIAMYRERPDMDDKLRVYLDNLFIRDLETLMKQQNWTAMKGLCERATKVRPRFGEVYLYQGVALKNEKKNQEAMSAFAKCYVTTNQFQKRAKQQLDVLYRAQSGGSLIGQEKIISQAVKDLNSR
jgi:tetratricopeptide (TPR) repeat protein